MITSIELKNFKSFREAKIDLERFTVFVGANASGKTSVLEAVELVTATRSKFSNLTGRNGPHGIVEVQDELKHIFHGDQNPGSLYTSGGNGSLGIRCDTDKGFIEINGVPNFDQDSALLTPENRIWKFDTRFDYSIQVGKRLFDVQYLSLIGKRIATPSYSRQSPPKIDQDGFGTSSMLAYMALNDPDSFQTLVTAFRQLIPKLNLQRIRFDRSVVNQTEKEYVQIDNDVIERQTTRKYQGDTILFDFENAPNVAAHAASEGTLILLGLLTVIMGPNRPKILLLDDIEHGLHPLAQKNLIETIGKLLEQFPDLQILATAHSPYLLDYLEPQQVRLLALDEKGHSVCGKLTDHPQFDKWKDEMAPGEMWSLFGEKWLTEGVAKS